MGNDADTGHDRDVDLGVSEEPEQVLPEESRASGMGYQLVIHHQIRWDKEAGSGDVIENHEDACRHQHGKCGQAHARGYEPCPGAQWQTHEAHAFDAEIEGGGDEVQGAQQLADTKQCNGSCPKDDTRTLAWTRNGTNRVERRVLCPATQGWSVAHEE